ncbi:PorV/PorQ family protein [Candidatus Margulisiibacteriota bacterium]
MKRTILSITIILLACMTIYASNAGDWLEIGPDARAIGMGGAQIAIANDAYVPFWNPAGLQAKQEVKSTFATLFGAVNYIYLGYTQPFDFGNLAFSYLSVGTDGFKEAEYIAATSTLHGYPELTGGSFSVGNSAFLVSYADNLGLLAKKFDFTKGLFQNWMQDVSVGSTFKILSQTIQNDSATGFGLDVGAQYQYDKKLRIGAVMYNIMPTNVNWSTGTVENIPIKIKTGISYQYDKQITIVADLDVLGYKRGGIYLGGQYQYNKYLSGRAGYNKNSFSLGLGLEYQDVTFDFSYTTAPASYMDTSTRFSLGYVFPMKKETKKEAPKKIKKKQSVIKKPAKIVKKPAKKIVAKPKSIVPKPKPVEMLKLPKVTKTVVAPKKVAKKKAAIITPKLTVTVPKEVKSVNVGIKGVAKNTKTLLVNGKKVFVRADGKFYIKKALKKGNNRFVIKAFSSTGQMKMEIRNIKRI